MAQHAVPMFNVAMSGIGTQTVRASCHLANPPAHPPPTPTTCPKHWRQMTQPLAPHFFIVLPRMGTQTVRATCNSAQRVHRSTTPTHHLPHTPCANNCHPYIRNRRPDSPGHLHFGAQGSRCQFGLGLRRGSNWHPDSLGAKSPSIAMLGAK